MPAVRTAPSQSSRQTKSRNTQSGAQQRHRSQSAQMAAKSRGFTRTQSTEPRLERVEGGAGGGLSQTLPNIPRGGRQHPTDHNMVCSRVNTALSICARLQRRSPTLIMMWHACRHTRCCHPVHLTVLSLQTFRCCSACAWTSVDAMKRSLSVLSSTI